MCREGHFYTTWLRSKNAIRTYFMKKNGVFPSIMNSVWGVVMNGEEGESVGRGNSFSKPLD